MMHHKSQKEIHCQDWCEDLVSLLESLPIEVDTLSFQELVHSRMCQFD